MIQIHTERFILLINIQGKDKAADRIKAELPDLAKKTTFLWIGLFTSNFWSYPMMKPAELVCVEQQ